MVTIVKKNNVRVLTKTLAVVSMLAPINGHSLGIGEIKLHSALNQNLDAEITLNLSGESATDIKVNLAPPEKFNEAGVSWSYFLSKIKFETIMQANGSAVIKLTSQEALKEPFLDFLLEVSWPKGNLYREFTVLVDPPSVYNQTAIPVSTRTESHAQLPVAMLQHQPHENGPSSSGEYGPTLTNDTLWSVAEHARGQGDISVEQMVLAIYQANPQAFYKGNVNALTAGKMLTIPEREEVLKLSRNQALAEFNRHTKAWRNHSASARLEKAKEQPVLSKVEGAGDNQLTLVAPTKKAIQGQAVVEKANTQVSAEKNSPDMAIVATETMKNVATGTESAADDAIQSKVAALEKQLAMMQQLIALKDQQLAALQNQSPEKSVVQDHPVPAELPIVKPADQIIPPHQPAPSEAVIAKPVEPAKTVPPKAVVQPAQPVVQPEPLSDNLYYLTVGVVGSAILTLLGWFWWRKRKVDEQTNTESMFASSTLLKSTVDDENIAIPVAEDGELGVLDVGTVGESSFLSEFTPSDFDSFDTEQGEIDPISEADVYLAYGRYQQAEELIRQAIKDQPNRDECKLKLLEIFYANEDKTAFEAYANELAKAGKRDEVDFWENAAEMGREICADSPLFSSSGDQKNDDDIDFDLSSFSMDTSVGTDQVVVAADRQSAKPSEDQVDEIDYDFSSFSMDTADTENKAVATENIQSGQSPEAMDFELTSLVMDADEMEQGVIAPRAPTAKPSKTQIEHIDFDLNSFSIESDSGVIASSAKAGMSSGAPIEHIDFDLNSFSTDTNESDQVNEDFSLSSLPSGVGVANKEQEFESYEFDFGSELPGKTEIDGLDFSALENADKNRQDIDFSGGGSLDLNDDLDGDFDFNFDLDMPMTTSGPDSSQHSEFGVSDLTDMDELETKLDLAKAYVDMGDANAAKDLAREVLEQGTDEQKNIAQALLDELD